MFAFVQTAGAAGDGARPQHPQSDSSCVSDSDQTPGGADSGAHGQLRPCLQNAHGGQLEPVRTLTTVVHPGIGGRVMKRALRRVLERKNAMGYC